MKLIRHAALAALLVVAVLVLGCQEDNVEFAGDTEELTFEGLLEGLADTDTHQFVITSQGIVRIELAAFNPQFADTGEPVEPQGLGVAFGVIVGEGCSATVSDLLDQNEALSVFVPEGVYCTGVFVPSGLYPVGTVFAYTLELTSGA